MTALRRTVIGCGIFEGEFREAVKGQDRFSLETIWLKAGYHTRPDLLESRLREAIDRLGSADGARILFGERCLADLGGTARGIRTLPSANCLTAMVGLERLRELETGPAMVVTTAWIRKIYLSRDPELPVWDEAECRMQLGRYERIVVLDTGVDPLTDEETLTAFDLLGRVLEFEKADLGPFRDLVLDFLA